MSAYLSSFEANVIGLFGSALIVTAYAYSNLAQQLNLLLFNSINLGGAVLLLISLTVNFNLPSVVLELVWIAIAIFGIGKALLVRRQLRTGKRTDTGPGKEKAQ